MSAPRIQALISGFLDRSATPRDNAELDDQLKASAEVAAQLVALAQIDQALQRHHRDRHAQSAAAHLLDRIEREAGAVVQNAVTRSSAPPTGEASAHTASLRSPVLGFLSGVWEAVQASPRAFVAIIGLALGGYFLVLFALIPFGRWAVEQRAGHATPADAEPGNLAPVADAEVPRKVDRRAANSVWASAGKARVGEPCELDIGVVETVSARGARIFIEGPARWQFAADDRLLLGRGRLLANVPPAAIGFTVVTPTAEVVDLGTEFGVDVNEAQETKLMVTKGVVELIQTRSADSSKGSPPKQRRVRAGQSMAVARDARGQWVTEAIRFEAAWVRRLPQQATAPDRNAVPFDIHWGVPTNVSNERDVSTAGTLFDSAAYFSETDLTVNGVTFKHFTGKTGDGPPYAAHFGTSQITIDIDFDPGGRIYPLEPKNDLERLLNHAGWSTNESNPLTITIDGLAVNRRYELQIFMPNWDTTDHRTKFYDDYDRGHAVVLRQGDVTAPAQYVLGVFTAGGSKQVINFQGVGTAGHGFLAAMQVRALPESDRENLPDFSQQEKNE